MRKVTIAAVILVILVGIAVLVLLNLRYTRPLQFVVLSFDSCRSLKIWDETPRFAEEMATKGINQDYGIITWILFGFGIDYLIIHHDRRDILVKIRTLGCA